MIQFIKTRWFPIGFILIVAVGLTRRYTTWFQKDFVKETKTHLKPEKYTEMPTAVVKMGLAEEAIGPPRQMPRIEDAQALAFLKRFSQVAVGERKRYGVPASVILAAAYVNSFAGQRPGSVEANNLFALPCGPEWSGTTVSINNQCYRRYDRAWDSFRDFSKYLSGRVWLSNTKQKAGNDWRKWVAALQDHQLSTVEGFGAEMQRVIEHYRLFELDEK